MHLCVLTRFPQARESKLNHPAPGYRERSNGVLSSVGSNGYSWSSSSDDSGDHYRGMHLHFHVTWLYPNDALYRVYGFQLRCLSE